MTNRRQLRYLCAGHFFHHYLIAVLPVAALAIQGAWSLSDGAALALGTPLYAMLALATLPAGWFGDLWPRRWLMAVCLIGSGLAAVLAGLSAGPLSLMIALGLLGACSAIYHPVGLAMVADYAERSGPAFARNGVWGNVGMGIAAALTALIVGVLGWRVAFILPGLMVIAVGARYAWLNRDAPSHSPVTHKEPSRPSGGPRVVLPALLLFLIAASLYDGLVAGAVTYPLPRIVEQQAFAGQGLLWIGGSTSLILVLGSLTQLASGWCVERVEARLLLALLFCGQIAVLIAVSLSGGPMIVPLLGLFHGLLYAWFPLTGWLIGHHMPVHLRARIFSLEYVASLAMTAAAVPLVAWLYDKGVAPGQQLWIVILAAVLVLGCIAALPGAPSKDRALDPAKPLSDRRSDRRARPGP
ncbi:MAG: MFS transporter [Pseudomonadota bacterium]